MEDWSGEELERRSLKSTKFPFSRWRERAIRTPGSSSCRSTPRTATAHRRPASGGWSRRRGSEVGKKFRATEDWIISPERQTSKAHFEGSVKANTTFHFECLNEANKYFSFWMFKWSKHYFVRSHFKCPMKLNSYFRLQRSLQIWIVQWNNWMVQIDKYQSICFNTFFCLRFVNCFSVKKFKL